MDIGKEYKMLKERGPNNPLPLQKVATITAAGLDRLVNHYAFTYFRDKKFRQLVNFDQLEQVEQDRIFNELVLAPLTLIMITLESPDLRVPDEMKDYYLLLKDQIPKAHIETLKGYGIEKKYLDDWEKLIEMRYQEYSNDKPKAREAAMELESRENNLNTKTLENIQLLLPVQTVAIGCHYHICRQKVKGKDELFKYTLRWLSKFYLEVRVPMEGGKITRWGRIRMGFRHLINRVIKKN